MAARVAVNSVPVRVSEEPRGLEGLVLTRRGRVVVWLLALSAVVGTVFGGVKAFAVGVPDPVPTTAVTVQSGDTVWGFAVEVAYAGEDVRDAVERILDVNGMVTADLEAGEQLLLPMTGDLAD